MLNREEAKRATFLLISLRPSHLRGENQAKLARISKVSGSEIKNKPWAGYAIKKMPVASFLILNETANPNYSPEGYKQVQLITQLTQNVPKGSFEKSCFADPTLRQAHLYLRYWRRQGNTFGTVRKTN